MAQYIMGVFSMSAVTVVCGFLSYKGKESGAVKFALATLLVYVTLTPLLSILQSEGGISLPKYEFNIDDYTEDYYITCENAFCQGIESLICKEYSLSESEVRVVTEGFRFETMRADRINITLSGKAALSDRVGIENFLNKQELGICEVRLEIG